MPSFAAGGPEVAKQMASLPGGACATPAAGFLAMGREHAATLSELHSMAGAILESPAFLRLGTVTFLGMLSPRHAARTPPMEPTAPPLIGDFSAIPDGTRLDHCFGVAATALAMCRALGFSDTLRRYAIAWALLHDIGNWPLSHTGEAAFSRVLGVGTRELRRRITLGDPALPARLSLRRELSAMGVDPHRLAAFFDRRPDEELRRLFDVASCPLSPDDLEGTWRSGRVFGLEVPSPASLCGAFGTDLYGDARIERSFEARIVEFWRLKSALYRDFIYRPAVVRWESQWVATIVSLFKDIGLVESLELTESIIVDRIASHGFVRTRDQVRHKPTERYSVARNGATVLRADPSISRLRAALVTSSHEMHGSTDRVRGGPPR